MNRLITVFKATRRRQAAKTKTPLIGLLFTLWGGVAGLGGCTNQPTLAELEALRQDAIAQNTVLAARQENRSPNRDWQFVVQGQTQKGEPVTLSLPELETLATTSIQTQEPHSTNDRNAILNFRGVAVSTLLNQFGATPKVTDVTFVAYDGYRATVNLTDLQQYPILIALKRNNQEIPRSEGGPLYLVFPYQTFPQLQVKYPDRFWAFYLTDMVVGTEPIQVQIGDRRFDAAALSKLPQVTLDEAVGYRIGWPVGKVKLYGVRVRDALTAAGLTLPPDGSVIVRGKPLIYRDPARPVRLAAADIQQCDLLLATHWGDNREPIPAKMGGPVTLALASECQTQSDDRRWVTFVEALEVKN